MINSDLTQLNSFQLDAVKDTSSACLVNAQVGSGKTTVLISKIFYLQKYQHVDFHDMVVLTFTNKAAEEIRARLSSADPYVTEADTEYFGTFHSVALKLLKTKLDLSSIGYDRSFSVITPEEKSEMAMRLISENHLDIKYKAKLIKRFELALKGSYMYGNMSHPDDMEKLINLLSNEKKIQQKMDFDDLINYSSELLLASDWRPKWIIVDEFQDSDSAQYEFIKSLCGSDTHVFAVGDPNQIIYSWRGSNSNIFSTFKEEYSPTVMSLPINYRSTGTILEAARFFVNDATELTCSRDFGEKVLIKNHYDSFSEAVYLCDRIQSLVTSGYEYKDIAILYRLQRQSKILENTFNRNALPFEISVRHSANDYPVLRWLIKLLRASLSKEDKDSFMYILTDKTYGLGLSKTKALKIYEGSASKYPPIYEKISSFIENFNLIPNMDLYSYFDLDEYIHPASASYSEDRKNTLKLLENISRCRSIEELQDFINSSALYSASILSEEISEEENSVKLMTLHASKGLEFKCVFIIGANYGVIPLRASSESEQDEEKRLFFVGLTRAKDMLEISYYTNPDEVRAITGPSSFLSMIPSNVVLWNSDSSESTDLQSLRHEIMNNRPDDIPVPDKHMAKHPKYGIGKIIKEDESTITVLFDGYGEKDFLKVFSEIEII